MTLTVLSARVTQILIILGIFFLNIYTIFFLYCIRAAFFFLGLLSISLINFFSSIVNLTSWSLKHTGKALWTWIVTKTGNWVSKTLKIKNQSLNFRNVIYFKVKNFNLKNRITTDQTQIYVNKSTFDSAPLHKNILLLFRSVHRRLQCNRL